MGGIGRAPKSSEREKQNFSKWRQCSVSFNQIRTWADSDLKKGWGFKAASRAWHVTNTGFDAAIVGPYNKNTPTTIEVKEASCVPGAPLRAASLYDVSQILARLATDRRDLEEQMLWPEQIPGLLKPLMS